MIVLSIETSCDDTGVALLDVGKGQVEILADFVSSQNEIHAPWGGVVPNLAVRAHYKNLPILIEAALNKAKTKKINPNQIDLIAATNGPGLEPCLWAGINIAKVLAKALNKPIVGVNHLEGHIAANWLKPIRGISKQNRKSKILNFKSIFPAICLIVSGGHTQLVLIKDIGKYNVIGQTRDDAAGEAFDKVAKILGFGYPGGPAIAKFALKWKYQILNPKSQINSNFQTSNHKFQFPRPMIESKDYDFSFSGLKTAVLYALKDELNEKYKSDCEVGHKGGLKRKIRLNQEILKDGRYEKLRQNISAAFQEAVVDVLVSKTIRAAVEYKAKSVMLAGGVAANSRLREQMREKIKSLIPNTQLLVPNFKYCADNAAMIGLAGYWKYMQQGKGDRIEKIAAEANLNF